MPGRAGPVVESVDQRVGERIRERRTLVGLTQHDLAAALGISYQQVRKDETAANRVSAGRLFQIARRLDADVDFFFAGMPSKTIGSPLPHGGKLRSTIDVAQHFSEIFDPEVRTAVAGLVKILGRRVLASKGDE